MFEYLWNYIDLEWLIASLTGLGIFIAMIVCVVVIGVAVVGIVGEWKMFEKMNMKGWYALIPYFGSYEMTKGVYGVGWWFLILLASELAEGVGIHGYLLTVIGWVVLVYRLKYNTDLALCFGQHWTFGLVLTFFPVIGMAILGLSGSIRYHGVKTEGPFGMNFTVPGSGTNP